MQLAHLWHFYQYVCHHLILMMWRARFTLSQSIFKLQRVYRGFVHKFSVTGIICDIDLTLRCSIYLKLMKQKRKGQVFWACNFKVISHFCELSQDNQLQSLRRMNVLNDVTAARFSVSFSQLPATKNHYNGAAVMSLRTFIRRRACS